MLLDEKGRPENSMSHFYKTHTHTHTHTHIHTQTYCNSILGDFPGGTVVKNPPDNAGDTGSSPGPG